MATVLFLSGSTTGDALGGIGRTFRPIFADHGLDFREINFAGPDAGNDLNDALGKQDVALAFSFAGMGADFRGQTADGKSVNLWEASRIPYISFYGDTPAYFFDRHVMPGNRFGTLYAFPEHYELRKRLPHLKGIAGVAPPSALEIVPRNTVDFKAKERGKLFFLKNGNDPEKLVLEWKAALPAATFLMIAEVASELASKVDGSDVTDIDATVTSYLMAKGYDVSAQYTLRLFFIAQLDDYLRRIKSTLMARTLMAFPVVIQGYNWEHIDFSRAKATFIHGGDYGRSAGDILGALGTIDMSPNTSRAPHERPLRAFGSYTLCLTNEQKFFRDNLPHCDEFNFTFTKESLEARVSSVLAQPRRYVEIGIAVAEAFKAKFPRGRFADFVLELTDLLRLAGGDTAAPLQPYFVWPPKTI